MILSPRSRLLAPFLVLALPWSAAAAQDPEVVPEVEAEPEVVQDPAPPVRKPEPDPDPTPDELRALWPGALARDARITFGNRTRALAAGLLDSEVSASDGRAAALYALGAVRSLTERPRLELMAVEGIRAERMGAVLGLGEMGPALGGEGEVLLVDLLNDRDEHVAACAVLALLRTGKPGWRELVEGFSTSADHPLASVARDLLRWVDDPDGSPPVATAYRLLDLRWRAACRFGSVDGAAWSVTLTEGLAKDPAFVEEVVFEGVAELALRGVRDSLVELLVSGSGTARVRAAMRVMPFDVEKLVDADLWLPTDEEWAVVVDVALETGVAPLLPKLMERVSRIEALAPSAAGILARNDPRYEESLLTALESEDPSIRLRATFAAGEGGLRNLLKHLGPLQNDPDFRVVAASLAARVRLGDATAHRDVQGVLVDGRDGYTAEQRGELIDALHRASRSPLVLDYIGRLVGSLAGSLDSGERGSLLAIQRLRGRVGDSAPLRQAFEGLDPSSSAALRILRALGRRPNANDLEFLARRFPFEGHRRANVEAAVALVRAGHTDVRSILAAGVWSGPWNQSVLAAAVVKETAGMRILEHWAERPPSAASSADLRRLGFAIGLWGGLEAVDLLKQRLGRVAGADRPALQGALLGALAARTH